MHRAFPLLIVAILAAFALAAPTPSKTHKKHSFKASAKGHGKPSPREAMQRAAAKYGLQIHFDDCEDGDDSNSNFGASESSAIPWAWWASSLPSWPWASAGAVAGGYGGSSSAASISSVAASFFPSSASFLPSLSVGPPPSASGAVPSSSFASVTAAPSSGAASSVVSPHSSSGVASASAPSSSSPSSGGGSEDGEVSATPEDNESEYLSPVTIGGQKLNLDFDTGSADLWVFSTEMSSGQSAGHTVFDPSKSSTFQTLNGASWQIQYGDGSTASGTVGYDTVNIGGATVNKQAIELAEQVASSFAQDTNNDGLLGLAFSTINQVSPQPQKTFFENVMADLDQPLFTADLEEDASGTYEFGSIDSSKYTGDIQYTAIDNSNGWWQFESNTYTVGGSQHQCTVCSPAIADTGTSLILVDQDVADTYYKGVNGATFENSVGGYVFPCSSTLPDFGVAIGSNTATIKGADMNYAPVDSTGSTCFGGVQGSGMGGQPQPVQIYGDVLLKQIFAVFDGGNQQFGFATKP